MKTAKLFCIALTVALTLVSISSLRADDDKNGNSSSDKAKTAAICDMKAPPVEDFAGTTLSYVMSNKDCSIFAKAIHKSGLEDMLANATACTIFAPSDKAFEKWSKEDMDTLFACPAALGALVLNHVCPKSVSPEQIKECCQKMKAEFREECTKIFGKENQDKCDQLCKAMKQKLAAKIREKMSDGIKDPAAESEAEPIVKAMPTAIAKCNNGYVYVIDKVRIPRGLRIYNKLKAVQASPVVMIETVEISGTFVPEDESAAPAQEGATPADSSSSAPKSDT
ncbi:MAG: fasciclin domain-containing protein [Thermoguttaceae bacterium]|nr:fasciclin domain-containing protein [Thermoguttaceae bacterium]